MKIVVNGAVREIGSSPTTSLLFVLREELGVTGPKAGCQQGGCGACTVLIDGSPRRSCLLPVGYLDGAEITTVEGLGTPMSLAPVQQAFVHHYAAQAYLDRGGTDDREAIIEALGGHVCRCTGYVKIIEAVAAAARGDTFDLTTTAPGKYTTVAGGAR